MTLGELRTILAPLRGDLFLVAQTGPRELFYVGDDPDWDENVFRLYANVPLHKLDRLKGTPVEKIFKVVLRDGDTAVDSPFSEQVLALKGRIKKQVERERVKSPKGKAKRRGRNTV